ncbi:sensor histidine kinase [Aquimarina algicola]|uniref:GHKL domain-containing protein n=1 Tax=Aquimarina algicola TaxID=2589995 RepID=A0A504JMU3_9FLAO|nr:sensor histidine kinase [Aquimarina algicola]TPN87740.1 GHKL domain-containing protein [Aquimarina algicola]
MSKFDTWIDNKVAQNLFIWFCFFIILFGTIQADNRWLASLFTITLLAPPIYLNNLFILPLLREKLVLFFFLFLINLLVSSSIFVYIMSIVLQQELQWNLWANFLGVMILALIFASAIKLARDSFYRRQQEKDAELKLLKAQLNPHFLFNTLNNLYGLSVIKSDKLPGLMLKLSDLLRYSLYDTKETFVPLEKEIRYLENYMSLEKIRLENTTEIQFHKKGDFTTTKIAPMVLIVFVENAFKHLETIQGKKSSVSVSLSVQGEKMMFSCINTFASNHHTKPSLETGKSGIGLQNAKKRLDLIYADKYKLDIIKKDEKFVVELMLLF